MARDNTDAMKIIRQAFLLLCKKRKNDLFADSANKQGNQLKDNSQPDGSYFHLPPP